MPITVNLVLAAVFFFVAVACIVPMQGLKGGNGSAGAAKVVFVFATLATVIFTLLYLAFLFAK